MSEKWLMLQALAAATVLASIGVANAESSAGRPPIWRPVALLTGGSDSPAIEPTPSTPSEHSSGTIDPVAFFQQLVDRYRSLDSYRDRVKLVQVTHRDGAETNRIETQLVCEIDEGALKVHTPSSQVRRSLGLKLPVPTTAEFRQAMQAYELWLAPHMALKFRNEPLKELRAGVEQGFTPTEAETVTVDEKPMLHLELKSGDGQSEHCDAKVDLFVNPDSMLVERIETEQRLPDGANFTTTLQITPEPVEAPPTSPAPSNQPPAAPQSPPAIPSTPPTHRPAR